MESSSNQNIRKNYFVVNRKLLNSDLWLSDKFSKGQAWVDLVGLAQFSDSTFSVRGMEIKVKRGQLAYSQVKLAERWKWSRNKVRRTLNGWEMEQRMKQQKNEITTVITILNYDVYQFGDTANDTTNDTTNDTHKKECINNDKEIINTYTHKNVKEKIVQESEEEELDKSSFGKLKKEDLKFYVSKNIPSRESYIMDEILNLSIDEYNNIAKTPYNKSSWLRDVKLIELFPLGLEVGIHPTKLKEFANSLYPKYKSGYTIKDKRKIKNFRQFFNGIIRRDQANFRRRFGELVTWNVPDFA